MIMRNNNNIFVVSLALASIAATTTTTVHCFQPVPLRTSGARHMQHTHFSHKHNNDPIDDEHTSNDNGRRRFFAKAAATAAAASPFLISSPALAGIDVSNLRTEGGAPSNSVVAAQLQGLSSSDNGTAASRLREIKQSTTSTAEKSKAAAVTAGSRPVLSKEELGSAATYARVSEVASIKTIGLTKLNSRYTGSVDGLPIQFDFPTDWLQLDRANNGIQYVDQRNGNKLYVLKAPLPPNTNLATVPKSFFDDSVFDANGDVVRFGTVVGAHRTAKSQMTQDDAKAAYLHRRLQLNYETLAGNGVQTIERRGLIDAYEIDGYAYMMLAGCNAVKFEKKDSPERATIDMIVDSFRLGQ